MNVTGFAPSAGDDLSTGFTALRADIPALHQEVLGKLPAYLEDGASGQRPQVVIDAMANHEQRNHANVHRRVQELSQRSTEAHEGAREKVRAFITLIGSERSISTK